MDITTLALAKKYMQKATEEEKQEIIQEVSKKIIVPTKTSNLENDSGFITNIVNDLVNYHLKSEVYTKEEVQLLIGRISSLELIKVDALPIEDIKTSAIYLVPSERSEEDNIYTEYIYMNDKWEIIGDTSIDLSQYALKTEIPTKLSQLTNDANYSQFSGSYNDLEDKPTLIENVTIDGVNAVEDGVANIPLATTSSYGVVKPNPGYGLNIYGSTVKDMGINPIMSTGIDSRQNYRPITGAQLDYAIKAAMTDGKGEAWTEDEQSASRLRIGAVSSDEVSVMITEALNTIGVAEEGAY